MLVSPARVVAQLLLDGGIAIPGRVGSASQVKGDGTTYLYSPSMPDTPDQALQVCDTAGTYFWRSQRGRDRVHPGFQILVRSPDPDNWQLAQQVADFLGTVGRQSLLVVDQTYDVQSVYRVGSILYLGEDPNRERYLWSINGRVAFQDTQIPALG
jgi:hypothetical protein